ncbi:MAG: hypothetical protein IJ005_01635 [Bacteroidales bacterium]|nr:hypothetical protein [Bacteroidales bacterium]
MKKIIYLIAAAFIAAVGCQSEHDRMVEQLVGDWHFAGEESGVKEDIWLSFSADGGFELYQKIGEGPYWLSTGEFTLDADKMVLSGLYSDRYPWKYDYKVSIGSDSLVMTAVGVEDYSVTYGRESIPASVRNMSLPLTKSDSDSGERYL